MRRIAICVRCAMNDSNDASSLKRDAFVLSRGARGSSSCSFTFWKQRKLLFSFSQLKWSLITERIDWIRAKKQALCFSPFVWREGTDKLVRTVSFFWKNFWHDRFSFLAEWILNSCCQLLLPTQGRLSNKISRRHCQPYSTMSLSGCLSVRRRFRNVGASNQGPALYQLRDVDRK